MREPRQDRTTSQRLVGQDEPVEESMSKERVIPEESVYIMDPVSPQSEQTNSFFSLLARCG